MDDATRLRLRKLLATQKALVSAVASGARAPDAEADYHRVLPDLRQILTAANRNCVCPWGSVHQWTAYTSASADLEGLLKG